MATEKPCCSTVQALAAFEEMQQEGCPANVVTYNTLLDVYGKLGHWEQALNVLQRMRSEVCYLQQYKCVSSVQLFRNSLISSQA